MCTQFYPTRICGHISIGHITQHTLPICAYLHHILALYVVIVTTNINSYTLARRLYKSLMPYPRGKWVTILNTVLPALKDLSILDHPLAIRLKRDYTTQLKGLSPHIQSKLLDTYHNTFITLLHQYFVTNILDSLISEPLSLNKLLYRLQSSQD